jgi:hypothetical protein
VAVVSAAIPASASVATPSSVITMTVHHADRTISVSSLSAVTPAVTNPCNGQHLVCLFQNGNGGGSIDAFDAGFLQSVGVWNLTNDPCSSCTNGIGCGSSQGTSGGHGEDVGRVAGEVDASLFA